MRRHPGRSLRHARSARGPAGCALIAVAIAAALSGACSRDSTLPPPWQSGELLVVTTNSATTLYYDRHERTVGPEHDLVMAFASARGWEVSWIVADTLGEIFALLDDGEVHLAAAGLTHLPERSRRFRRGPAYRSITQQVLCHRTVDPMPDRPQALAGRTLVVAEGSSYVAALDAIRHRFPALDFDEHDRLNTEALMARVASGERDCTVADSHIAQVMRRSFPALEIAFDLTGEQAIGWYLPRSERRLSRMARRWMRSRDGKQALAHMEARYFSYIGDFDFVDLRALSRRIRNRLPQYRRLFLAAEQSSGMPADLLAAVSYQESHWNPRAVSPTGVRGMMMLTRRTARELGIQDRTDAAQSIDAGARYLADLHARLPEHIAEPDRTYLALASYNIGRGHLLDARQLARELGKDPDDWEDMREVLPLLADERYHQDLRYGYARGYEAVHFVNRVRNYRDVIRHAFE